MITVIIIMTTGIIVGYLLRTKDKIIKISNKSTIWIIFILLFFMGVSVGSNSEVMQNLDTIGIRGLQLAVVTILGSVILSWIVYHFILKPNKLNNER